MCPRWPASAPAWPSSCGRPRPKVAVNITDLIERLCAQTRRGLARLDGKGWRALVEEIIDEILVLLDRNVRIHGLLGPSRIGPGVEESV